MFVIKVAGVLEIAPNLLLSSWDEIEVWNAGKQPSYKDKYCEDSYKL